MISCVLKAKKKNVFFGGYKESSTYSSRIQKLSFAHTMNPDDIEERNRGGAGEGGSPSYMQHATVLVAFYFLTKLEFVESL